MNEQLTLYDLDIWSGKTSPELSAATKARTSEQSLKKLQELRIKPPLFLDLRGGGGQQAAVSWQTGGQLLGEYTMRSFGECPNVENVSRLSQILTDRPHPKYFLSARACAGILRRAENRSKELPPMLKEALMKQSASLNVPVVKGVKAYSYSENEQGHYQHSTINQCFNISGDDILGTLDASYYRGVGARSGKEREVVAFGISAYDSNMKSNNPHSGIYEADTSRTLDNNGGSPACNQGGIAICLNKQRCDKFVENNVASTMSARQYKDESDIVAFEPRSQDGVHRISKDLISPTLNTAQGGQRQPCVMKDVIVRRLTPLECERLQGYPDNWTDIGNWVDSKGKFRKTSDAARYKALGNSIALPFWQWLADRIIANYTEPPTIASLFDGIGGFPLVFSRAGAIPVWASEIEPFPVAVTKRHFPEEGENND